MKYHNRRFPNESDEYREKRLDLLKQEINLRAQIESLANQRMKLPLGGKLKEDYSFEYLDRHGKKQSKNLSQLFAPGKDSLAIYSLMYSADMDQPCSACTSILDGFNGCAHHISDRINLAVVAQYSIEIIDALARSRDWDRLTLLSSRGNSYNHDYFAVNDQGEQIPALNIFTRTDEGIFHFYNTELLYVDLEGHPRHVDLLWPVWNLLDLTPEGRGTDWFPQLSYD